tara:strand:- start:304 stop:582 length:279 start_codon:yes stop_codon:yes gene_type:complete
VNEIKITERSKKNSIFSNVLKFIFSLICFAKKTNRILFNNVSIIVPNLVAPMELFSEKNHIKTGKRFPNKPLSKKEADHDPLVNLKLLDGVS